MFVFRSLDRDKNGDSVRRGRSYTSRFQFVSLSCVAGRSHPRFTQGSPPHTHTPRSQHTHTKVTAHTHQGHTHAHQGYTHIHQGHTHTKVKATQLTWGSQSVTHPAWTERDATSAIVTLRRRHVVKEVTRRHASRIQWQIRQNRRHAHRHAQRLQL